MNYAEILPIVIAKLIKLELEFAKKVSEYG